MSDDIAAIRQRILALFNSTRNAQIVDNDTMCERCNGVKSLTEQVYLSASGLPFTPCLCPLPPRLEDDARTSPMWRSLAYWHLTSTKAGE